MHIDVYMIVFHDINAITPYYHLYSLVGKSVGLSYSWSCCAGDLRFESRPWHYSRASFFYPTRQLARFSTPNISYIVNYKFVCPIGEALNNTPYSSSSFMVVEPLKITIISTIIINIIIIINHSNNLLCVSRWKFVKKILGRKSIK